MTVSTIVLDSPILGIVTNPKASPENLPCRAWLDALLENGRRVVLPEIADYEVRRELLRARRVEGLARLDAIVEVLDYRPLTTAMMRLAAQMWAEVRQRGRPTSDPHAIDADVILSAQALLAGAAREDLVVATTNIGHLSLFVPVAGWRSIG